MTHCTFRFLKVTLPMVIACLFGSLPQPSWGADSASDFVRHAALGDLGYIRVAIERGQTPDQPEPVHHQSALLVAAANGHAKVVQTLLETGASVDVADRNGVTPLVAAAAAGHVQVVEQLLRAKADPNWLHPRGSTALVWAAWHGREKVVAQLLAAGANPVQVDSYGNAPLAVAQMGGRTRVLVLLRQSQGGINP